MINYTKRPQPGTAGAPGPGRPAPSPAARALVTWDQLIGHVHRRYAVGSHHGPEYAVFDAPTGMNDEYHVVSVRLSAMQGSQQREWAVIQSPICPTGSADPLRVIARADLYMVGGVVADDELLYLRHAMTLPALSLQDFDAAVDAVGSTAYKIEAWLLGTYRY